jgi:hypothetical protein
LDLEIAMIDGAGGAVDMEDTCIADLDALLELLP